MLGIRTAGRMDRRAFALALTTAFLAGCAVIPKTTGPAPTPTGPDENVLPTDDGRHRIALLVPMTGPNGAVGQSIANATTMAILDANASQLRITTYDTATGAGSAAARAIADGNKLILGPLLGETTGEIVAKARPAKVPLISFSNDVSTAARDVFLMGHIPDQSISRAVAFARTKGHSRFAALIPSGEYGKRAELSLAGAVKREGGTLAAVERYDRGSTAIVAAAQNLRREGAFDTLLIADGARLSAIAAGNLDAPGATRPQLLGTELWSGEASVPTSKAMNGAWFAAVSDARFKQFSARYKTRFSAQPYRIATLGYDAVLLTLKISRTWKPGSTFPSQLMLDKGGFVGMDGPFRFMPNGVVERAMEVREVRNGAVTVVSPAPTKFED